MRDAMAAGERTANFSDDVVARRSAAEPRGSPRGIGGIVTDRSLCIISDLNGESFGDPRTGDGQAGGEKRSDFGLVPAGVDPIGFLLCFG